MQRTTLALLLLGTILVMPSFLHFLGVFDHFKLLVLNESFTEGVVWYHTILPASFFVCVFVAFVISVATFLFGLLMTLRAVRGGPKIQLASERGSEQIHAWRSAVPTLSRLMLRHYQMMNVSVALHTPLLFHSSAFGFWFLVPGSSVRSSDQSIVDRSTPFFV